MTAVMPQASEFPQVSFSDDEWVVLEGAIGAPLDARWRGRIREAADNFVVTSYLDAERSSKRKMLGVVRKDNRVKQSARVLEMIRDMDSLVRRWTIASREAGIEFARYDATVPPSHRGLQAMMGDVQFHRIALRNWLDEDWKKTRPRATRGTPFDQFVKRLAGIYRGVRRTDPTNAVTVMSGGDGESMSDFTKFVRALNELLPAAARRPGVDTPGAWVAALRRSLAKQDD